MQAKLQPRSPSVAGPFRGPVRRIKLRRWLLCRIIKRAGDAPPQQFGMQTSGGRCGTAIEKAVEVLDLHGITNRESRRMAGDVLPGSACPIVLIVRQTVSKTKIVSFSLMPPLVDASLDQRRTT